MLEELVERHGTRGQARFLAESRGESFADIEAAHAAYERSLASLTASLPAGIRTQRIDRGFLPNFLIGPHDLVVTLGQDGLVVNVVRSLTGQPLVAFDAGMRARITVADERQLALVWPASRGRAD